MRQLPYSSSAAPIHFDFPVEWSAGDLSALTLAVYDEDGNVLQAADPVTLYTDTSLEGAAAQFASEIELDSAAAALAAGDVLEIHGTSAVEVVRIKGLDVTNDTYELESILDNAYDDNDVVIARFANYDLDISTVATFTAGIVLTLVWTPTGTGRQITTMRQVAVSALDVAGLRRNVLDVYPRVYRAFTQPTDKFDRMAQVAERQLGNECSDRGIEIQRVVDQDRMIDVISARMAWLWALGGDEDMIDERKVLGVEDAKQTKWLLSQPVFTDDNQDKIKDDGEYTSREYLPSKGW